MGWIVSAVLQVAPKRLPGLSIAMGADYSFELNSTFLDILIYSWAVCLSWPGHQFCQRMPQLPNSTTLFGFVRSHLETINFIPVIDYCFVHSIFRFWFWSTKLQKYQNIT